MTLQVDCGSVCFRCDSFTIAIDVVRNCIICRVPRKDDSVIFNTSSEICYSIAFWNYNYLVESGFDAMTCFGYILECVACNCTLALSVNNYIFNFVAFVCCNDKFLVVTAVNFNISRWGYCSAFACTCRNYVRQPVECCVDALRFGYIGDCI